MLLTFASQCVSDMMKATEITESDVIGIALLRLLEIRERLSKWAESLHWFLPEKIHFVLF